MHHTGTIAFETERLLCRPFKQEDCEDMLKNWIANPNVQSEYGEPVYTTLLEVETLLNEYIRNYQKTDMQLTVKNLITGRKKKLDAFVYIMHEERELGIPSSVYVRTCVAGYRHFGFDLKHLRLAMDISERGEIV